MRKIAKNSGFFFNKYVNEIILHSFLNKFEIDIIIFGQSNE